MKHFICFFIAILILLKSDLSLMLYMSCVYIICCIGMVEYELIYICRWATKTTRFYCKKMQKRPTYTVVFSVAFLHYFFQLNPEKLRIGFFSLSFYVYFIKLISRKATNNVLYYVAYLGFLKYKILEKQRTALLFENKK